MILATANCNFVPGMLFIAMMALFFMPIFAKPHFINNHNHPHLDGEPKQSNLDLMIAREKKLEAQVNKVLRQSGKMFDSYDDKLEEEDDEPTYETDTTMSNLLINLIVPSETAQQASQKSAPVSEPKMKQDKVVENYKPIMTNNDAVKDEQMSHQQRDEPSQLKQPVQVPFEVQKQDHKQQLTVLPITETPKMLEGPKIDDQLVTRNPMPPAKLNTKDDDSQHGLIWGIIILSLCLCIIVGGICYVRRHKKSNTKKQLDSNPKLDSQSIISSSKSKRSTTSNKSLKNSKKSKSKSKSKPKSKRSSKGSK